MAHIHPVHDSDEHYTIDPISRSITNVTSKKVALIQYDHNSEVISFDIPKTIEGHDMTLCNDVKIHFINTGSGSRFKNADIYVVNDLCVMDTDPDKVVFTWTVPASATQYSGSLVFLVTFQCIDENNAVTYRWSTDVNNTISIKPCIDNGDSIVEEYSSLLEQWRIDLFGEGQSAVQTIKNATEEALLTIPDDYEALSNSAIAYESRSGLAVIDGMLYLTLDGEVISEGIELPAGGGSGGGGGGSSDNNAIMTLTNTTGWLAKTIALGAPVSVNVNWSSLENELSTGNGTLFVYAGGKLKLTKNVTQGDLTIDIGEYLAAGSNTVRVNIQDVYRNSKTVYFTITAVSAVIASDFDATGPFSGSITYTYTPSGNVEKTVHFVVDGTEIGTSVVTTSGRQQNYIIPAQSHGAHSLLVYYTCDVEGEIVSSNELYYDLVCIEDGNSTPIIASAFRATEAVQYESIVIPYKVYSPDEMTSAISLNADGVAVNTLTVDRAEQTWTYRADQTGALTLSIVCGSVSKVFNLNITETTINISAETNDLALYLSSYGRSNNEEDPSIWTSGDISASLTGFNFTSDGWQSDSEGNTVLRVAGDARVTIPYQAFGTDFRSTGKTIEIEFATSNVTNYDAEILSCYSGDRGIKMTAQQALIKSEQSEMSTPYKENEHIRIAFVIDKRTQNRLVRCYIDGVQSGLIQYPVDDDFSQYSPVGISIGSNSCTTDIYCIRVYDNNLTRYQILDNWIADTQNVATKIARYHNNDVFDEYGQIVIEKLPTDTGYLVITCPELPQYKGDKKVCSGYYTDRVNPSKSFSFENAQIDVQGTSSQYYSRKNYKIKFKGGFILTNGTTVDVYAMNDTAVPTDVFCFKADVASSEGANNVELVKLYEQCAKYLGILTPPQEDNYNVRQGIDGFPIVIFWDNGTEVSFLGKANFNNDKSSEEVFGFADGDESWETLSNTSQLTKFKTNVFSSKWNEEDFEGRFPDGNTDNTTLSALVNWLYSTYQEGATGAALAASYTDVDGTVHTVDNAAYRLAKYKTEFENYFDKGSSTLYYLFTLHFLMVDSRQKNSFPTYWAATQRWTWLPYDMDTALGINNRGKLVFGYNLEDIDKDGNDFVFNGQDSVMWVNFRQAFLNDAAEMYQNLRGSGFFSYDSVENAFEEHQSKWPPAIFNEDSFFKYEEPLIDDGDGSYLSMALGDKKLQRKWWLFNRFRYSDSMFVAGDALTQYVMIRPYYNVTADELAAGAVDLTITPYADIYVTTKFDATTVQKRAAKGVPIVIENPLSYANDAVVAIYSADQIADLGDLSPLNLGYADFSRAIMLQNIKVGDATTGYVNDKLTTLTVGNNTLLSTIDARNCINLTQTVDLSGCTGVEHAYFDGTAITGCNLPNGGILKTLHLPGTITNLTIRNQRAITDFTMDSYANITTLRLENVSNAVPTIDILNAISSNSRVRLIGINWTMTDAEDILALYDRLDTMRGLDENGNNVDRAQLSGTITVDSLTGAQLASMIERYPNVTISYSHIASYCYFYNNDGSELLYTAEVMDGADAIYVGNTPTKSSTAQYTFSFVGWNRSQNATTSDSSALTAVTMDRYVYAAFAQTIRTYTVRFYNGTTLLQIFNNVAYGGTATYTGTTPEKGEPDFEFIGFVPSGENITGETNCYAQYRYTGVITPKLIERKLTNYESDTLTAVGDYAFREDKTITSFVAPNVTSVGEYAFYWCSKLSNIELPAMESVGPYAFYECNILYNVELSHVQTIGKYAFYDCRASSIIAPVATRIENNAFQGANGRISHVDVPNATFIGSNAFNNCTKLETVNAPNAAEIGENAFGYCQKLQSITLPSLINVSRDMFRSCNILRTVDLEVANAIQDYAFEQCFSLTSLILRSETICYLRNEAVFNQCYHLLGTVNATYNPNGDKDGYIYVPDNLVEDYKVATNWSAFASQIKPISELEGA